MPWHLLQTSDVLDREFGAALSESVSLLAWEPRRTLSPWTALAAGGETEQFQEDPGLRVRSFPLLRGFARSPIAELVPSASAIVRRLLRQSENPQQSPLILTTPYFAEVAEMWPGPVIYWLTDLIAEYSGAERSRVELLDARLCRVATLVCPNSTRVADYLVRHAGCDPRKLHVLPNATRSMNLLPAAPTTAAVPPADVLGLSRPIAGVIGNLAGNMDWKLLASLVDEAPRFSWLFVGPTGMRIHDQRQSAARDAVISHPRAHFIGPRPYGALAGYARCFDVAVLPYRRHEPTYSGSSTRFYEHLAACRPMLATRGFEELLHKEPLLTLIDTADQGADALDHLRRLAFDDGLAQARWLASQEGTWQRRARTLRHALSERWMPSASRALRAYA